MFNKKIIVFLFAFLFVAQGLFAKQRTVNLSPAEVKSYKNQCRQMVDYLTSTLNFLGDPSNPPSQKEIIINSSYLKIFRDNKVQIEGDLVPNRPVPLNKDVQAYLKDVVFFFKRVHFSTHINRIDALVNPQGKIYFKVNLIRTLKGITFNNDTIDNDLPRYIEINLNEEKNDLKIASIYTHKPNENSELKYWWNHLSQGWKDYFGQSIRVYDTLPLSKVISFSDSSLVTTKKVAVPDTIHPTDSLQMPQDTTAVDSSLMPNDTVNRIDTTFQSVPDTIQINTQLLYEVLHYVKRTRNINVAGNLNINNLDPLSELPELTSVNVSHTLIEDLTPLRSLNKLENLNISGCPVRNLGPMRYASGLRELDASYTMISNMGVLGNLRNLESINLSYAPVDTLKNLSGLSRLKTLNLAGTKIQRIDSLASLNHLVSLDLARDNLQSFDVLDSLTSLQNLDLDTTNIVDLTPLQHLTSLSVLHINSTKVKDLSPLAGLKNLKYIYCDNSGVGQKEAELFLKLNRKCQVIYNSEKLENWWTQLPGVWKTVFIKFLPKKDTITKEELHLLLQIGTLNLSGNKDIHDLAPLSMLNQLTRLNLSGTSVSNLDPLSAMGGLRELNISHTAVRSLRPLEKLNNLKKINLEYTAVSNLMPLVNNSNLARIDADHSNVKQQNVLAFRKKNPQALVIYQSPYLHDWWNHLNKGWKTAFFKIEEMDSTPTNVQLQQLVNHEKLIIDYPGLQSGFKVLKAFSNLSELSVNNSSLTDISGLGTIKTLRSVRFSNCPLYNISTLAMLSNLREINLENTGVEDLTPLQNLRYLETLNISGTRVKKLKPLQGIRSLEKLYINNTPTRRLKYIMNLPNIKLLRCDHTNISEGWVNDFRRAHPKAHVVYY